MMPVMQTTFGFPNGNCFAACIASLLEIPIEETPLLEGRRFSDVWNEWLASRGMAMVWVAKNEFFPGYAIAYGKSPRGGLDTWGRPVTHAVVMKNMEMVHGPHFEQKFLDGEPNGYAVLYPLDPTILKKWEAA